MFQTIARFGFLAAVLMLLLVVSEYAVFLRPRPMLWWIAGAALLLLGVGLWIGRTVFHRPKTPAMDEAARDERLQALGISAREFEVLQLVAEGLSNQQIAGRLFISESTVKSHVSNLLVKLDASRRTQAVTRAREEGLLTDFTTAPTKVGFDQ